MRIALINTSKKNLIYPLGLLKIAGWQKAEGNECVLFNNTLPERGEFDEIWVSTLFTYEMPHQLKIIKEATKRSRVVKVGGISASLLPDAFRNLGGVSVHVGLLPQAEKFSPDYSILGEPPSYLISHTSRGCVRKCGFCMVKNIEPEYGEREGWEKDISGESKKVLFFDNNWLAKSKESIQNDILKLKNLVECGRINEIDFNQGLDCRLLTEELSLMLRDLPMRPVRFAFDGMHEDGYFQKAIDLMVRNGRKNVFVNYVLYNYKDSPDDFYYRLREGARLSEEYGISCDSFPMRYQPIMKTDIKREHVGEKWTQQELKNFVLIRGSFFPQAVIPIKTIKEFNYIFTDSPEKFKKLLRWNKAKEYSARKIGKLRLERYNDRKGK